MIDPLLDRIIQSGGYVNVNTGGAPDANALPISKTEADLTMDTEGFGACTNQFECEAVCPKEISVKFISKMNQEYRKAV